MFGFGARNQDVWGDVEGEAVEFAFAGDVLDGLAFAAALNQACITDRAASREVVFGVRHQPGFVFADHMQQQCLCVALRTIRVRAIAELRFGLGEPITQRHQAA